MADLVYTRLKAWCETKSQKTEFKKSIDMKKAAFKNYVCKKKVRMNKPHPRILVATVFF